MLSQKFVEKENATVENMGGVVEFAHVICTFSGCCIAIPSRSLLQCMSEFCEKRSFAIC